jgi:hypothetical protein
MSLTKGLGNGSKVQCRKYRMGEQYAWKCYRIEVKYCAEMPGLEYRTVQEKYLVGSAIGLALCTVHCTVL